MTPTDRRTRKREERRSRLLDLAADLVERDGIDAVTMTALAEAADYAPASLYTYFPSRSALIAALQQQALATLADVGEQHLAHWQDRSGDLDPEVAALVQLWAFCDLFVTAPQHHRREFRLQQQLLVTPGVEEVGDAAAVVPAAMSVLDLPRRLISAAVVAGALEPAGLVSDPVDTPVDGDLMRTFAWVVALNGALLIDGLSTGAPSTGAALGAELTSALLRGWGGSPELIARARHLAQELAPLQGAPS